MGLNEQLFLENIRGVLIRLEDTIIFDLIERSQFRVNAAIYEHDRFPDVPAGDSLMGFLLHATEKAHAQIRRYTSPDEAPFFADLPDPILPPLAYRENPLKPNSVNLTASLREVYEERIVPYVCREGDDGQYGSSCVHDVSCLQDMARRVHTGKFVAESKYRSSPARFQKLIDRQDAHALMVAITDTDVELRVLQRVRSKARSYVRELADASIHSHISPDRVADVFSNWLIPITKHVEIQYLLARG